MKFFKKFAAVLIAAAVFTVGNIGILPRDAIDDFMFSVRAADSDIVASGECGSQGDNLTWTFDSEGTLIISGTGDMDNWFMDYSFDNNPWQDYYDLITTVIIENSVTSIGDHAFYSCDALTSITIPDSVTSIGDYAFGYCKALTLITIPNSVTSVGDHAFYKTPWFESQKENNTFVIVSGILIDGKKCVGDVVIPDGVTSIRKSAFSGCESLTSIALPDGVTCIEDYAFSLCKSLTSITIPDSVTSIGYGAFQGCESLTSITLPNGITNISARAFEECYKLTSITIPDSVTSIGNKAFYFCKSLTSITIPDSVTSIEESTFYYCDSLTSITLPDSVTSIGNNAFENCSSLTSITLPDSVTSIGYGAFQECESLTSITFPNGITNISASAFEECYKLTSITIPDSVTSIGNKAFYFCKSLTSITIPDSVTSIGNNVFLGCESLTSITIPDSVTSIGNNVFLGCESLISIYVDTANVYYSDIEGVLFDKNIKTLIHYPIGNEMESYIIPDIVTSIESYAFSHCKSLTSITIPDSVTSIGDYAFGYCEALTSITLPDSVTSIGSNVFWETPWFESKKEKNAFVIVSGMLIDSEKCEGDIVIPEGVKIIGDSVFKGCNALTSITIPDGVANIGNSAFEDCSALTSIIIPDSVTSIGNYAFKNCSSLTTITIPDGVTNIGNSTFEDCSALTSIIIPDSVTSIGDKAFSSCKSLTSITLSDNVISIGEEVFSSCKSLTYITIPDSVTSIENYAFRDCENLTSVTLPDSVTSIEYFAFDGCNALTKLIISDGSKTITSATTSGFEKSIKEVIIPCNVTSIGDEAFMDFSALASIIIPDSVTSIGNSAFEDCSALTSITIPDSVTSIGNSAFEDCSALTSITIPNNVTSIGDKAFWSCENLTTITIPDSVTSIGDSAFCHCESLTSIIIPDSVTSIGNYAFSNCKSLTSITIPNSITSLNNIGLDNCYNLTDIIRPRIKNYSFTDNINEETILAEVTPVKLNRDLYSTYDKITDYNLFGHLDRLQEVCTVSGEIYAVYGEEDSIIMIPKNQSLQSIEIMNEGYTFGAATIGDDDYLYVMWGKSISDDVINESLQEENIIIAKYDLNGNVIDECGLSVDFTDAQFPFDAGNANIEYSNGIIGVLYDTEWTVTRTGDGLHHQGSEFVSLDAVSMELKNFVSNNTSHSFGVSMIATENGFVAIERGDCYPRGINFTQFTKSQSIEKNCFHASGQYKESGSHQNDTHTYMGGLEKSASTYAITGKSERFYTSGNYAESNLSTGNYDVFVRIIDSTLYDIAATDLAGENRIDEANGRIADRNVIWLTECNETEKAGNVKIVTLEDGSYCVLWEKIVDYEFDTIQYVILDECGNILRRQSTIYDARLSNTSIQPIVQGDTLTWAVSDGQTDEIIWYTVNLNEYRTEPAYLLGDVNEDGSVDSSDASLVLAEYAKIQTGGAGEFTDIQYKAADVNKDDTVDSSDASKILAYYAMVSTGKKPTWD